MIYGRKTWGPKAWHLLQVFAINQNKKISNNKKHNYYIFYTSFIYILPCLQCSQHYSDIINYINPIIEEDINRKYLIRWIFDVHNIVNSFLNKPQYNFEKYLENNKNILNNDILFIIDSIFNNFNYNNMSLHKFDQIVNFFFNFCLLYPDLKIRKKLKKIIKKNNFDKIETPLQFEQWFKNNFSEIKNILT